LSDELPAVEALSRLRKTRLFGLAFRMVHFSQPLMSALPFFVVEHEDVDGGLGASLRLAPFVFLPLATFRTFWLDHPQWPLLSYDDLLALGRLSLRWPNQDLLPIKLDHVHVLLEMDLWRASFGDFLQISIVLRVWPIEFVIGKHCLFRNG
jgi:hypothetical protein